MDGLRSTPAVHLHITLTPLFLVHSLSAPVVHCSSPLLACSVSAAMPKTADLAVEEEDQQLMLTAPTLTDRPPLTHDPAAPSPNDSSFARLSDERAGDATSASSSNSLLSSLRTITPFVWTLLLLAAVTILSAAYMLSNLGAPATTTPPVCEPAPASSSTDGLSSLPQTCPPCPTCPTTATTCPAPPPCPTVECPPASSVNVSAALVNMSSPNLCNSTVYPVEVPADLRKLCVSPYPMTPYIPPTMPATDLVIGLLTVDRYRMARDEYVMHTWLTPQRAPRAYFTCTIPRPDHVRQPCVAIPNSNDEYLSNINKTLIGLREIYYQHPDAKWYDLHRRTTDKHAPPSHCVCTRDAPRALPRSPLLVPHSLPLLWRRGLRFWLSSDDAYVNVHYTLSKLEKLDSDSELLLGEGYDFGPPCPNTNKHVMYAAGGAGMIVSRALMQRVAPLIEPWLLNEWWPEKPGQDGGGRQYGDVAVGCFFDQQNISMTWLPGHHHATPLFGPDRPSWETTLSNPQPGDPHNHPEVNNWHYVDRDVFMQADLFYGLQMVDRMERNGQVAELAHYARQVIAERYYQQQRSMELLWHERQN